MASSFGLDPQILAQLAAAGFKPPPPMQMAPMNLNPQMPNPGPQQQQGGGDGIAGGLAGLGAMMPGIAKAFGGMGAAGADLNGFNGSGPKVDVGGGQMLPNPNGMQFGAGGVPLGTPAGQPDFLTGLLSRFGFGGH